MFLRTMREVTESWRYFTDTKRKIFERLSLKANPGQKEPPKILMTYRVSPHQISGKSSSMQSNSNTAASALDRDHRSKCSLYQAKLKDYHDSKQHASPHNFSVGDVVFELK